MARSVGYHVVVNRAVLTLFVLVALTALVAWSLLAPVFQPRSAQEIGVDTLLDPAFWSVVIDRYGARVAREEYLRISNEPGLSIGIRHSIAHAFSYALYEEEGPNGMRLCGNEHHFGCVHGMMARTFVDSGGSFDVIRICESHPDRAECEHGLGHGFLALRDYTIEDLDVAMMMCESSSTSRAIYGCSWGVIMEWYYHTMTGVLIREPVDPYAYELCQRFMGHARTGCIYNMPSLWMHETPFQQRGTATIEAIAARCSSLSTPQDRIDCAHGTGRMVAATTAISPEDRESVCLHAFNDASLADACVRTVSFYEIQNSSMNRESSRAEILTVAMR